MYHSIDIQGFHQTNFRIWEHTFCRSDDKLLKKIQAIETTAIKIAFNLAPWATNHWCYSYVNFEKILTRLKTNSTKFLNRNSEDDLIKPLIESAKPSHTGKHSAIYKALNW